MEGEYYSTGDISPHIDSSVILKRSVLKEKLKMSKPALVKYNVCEAAESGPIFWYINSSNEKTLCKMEDMKVGT